MRGWKMKKGGKADERKGKPQAAPVPLGLARQDADALAVAEARRAAARRARRDAARRARRLVASWAKATAGWRPEDAVSNLEVRVSRAIRSAAERGAH